MKINMKPRIQSNVIYLEIDKNNISYRNTETDLEVQDMIKPCLVDRDMYPYNKNCVNPYILSGYRLHFNTPAKILKS